MTFTSSYDERFWAKSRPTPNPSHSLSTSPFVQGPPALANSTLGAGGGGQSNVVLAPRVQWKGDTQAEVLAFCDQMVQARISRPSLGFVEVLSVAENRRVHMLLLTMYARYEREQSVPQYFDGIYDSAGLSDRKWDLWPVAIFQREIMQALGHNDVTLVNSSFEVQFRELISKYKHSNPLSPDETYAAMAQANEVVEATLGISEEEKVRMILQVLRRWVREPSDGFTQELKMELAKTLLRVNSGDHNTLPVRTYEQALALLPNAVTILVGVCQQAIRCGLRWSDGRISKRPVEDRTAYEPTYSSATRGYLRSTAETKHTTRTPHELPKHPDVEHPDDPEDPEDLYEEAQKRLKRAEHNKFVAEKKARDAASQVSKAQALLRATPL